MVSGGIGYLGTVHFLSGRGGGWWDLGGEPCEKKLFSRGGGHPKKIREKGRVT